MTIKTEVARVEFRKPFFLPSIGETLPAGVYRIVVDREEIEGLSFLASRHSATMLHLPALGETSARSQVLAVDPAELEEALARDKQT